MHPSLPHLMATAATTGLADSFRRDVAAAHAHRLPLRVDEINSVSCGADRAVSHTFASSLWAVDAMFELARVGVDGVNVHTFPGAGYELFRIARHGGRWSAAVAPEYYGLILFARAAPPGSRLLRVSGRAGGQSFGEVTDTGDLTGARDVESVNATSGRYVVHLPAASAALLTTG